MELIKITNEWEEVEAKTIGDLREGDAVTIGGSGGFPVRCVNDGSRRPFYGYSVNHFFSWPVVESMLADGTAKVYRKAPNILDHPAFADWELEGGSRTLYDSSGKTVAEVFMNRTTCVTDLIDGVCFSVAFSVTLQPGEEQDFANIANAIKNMADKRRK